eukprot:6419816-Ditylum_brightwellii.AAC.1
MTHNCKCSALAKYVMKSDDELTKIVWDTQTPTQKFLLKFASHPKFTNTTLANDRHHAALLIKHMHGKFLPSSRKSPRLILLNHTFGSNVQA